MVDTFSFNQQSITIPVWLRDTYARIEDKAIVKFDSFPKVNERSEIAALAAINSEPGGSKHFITSNKMFGYLYRNTKLCRGIITIVIPNLRNLYWDNRYSLVRSEQIPLETAMDKHLPVFYDIFDYRGLQYYRNFANVPEYQIIGNITPYDVVHVSAVDFIDRINKNQPILIGIPDTNIIISLDYEQYDLWDDQLQKLITNITLPIDCK